MKRSSFSLLAVLLLTGLHSVPEALAQPPAHKQTVFRMRRVDAQTFLYESTDGTPFAAVRVTPNFAIYYNQAGPGYQPFVSLVANTLEEAWRYFHAQGYRHPSFADSRRIAVYIRPRFTAAAEQWAAGFYRLHPASGDPYFDILYHDLSVGDNRVFIRAACTHEFFHFIQHAYDPNYSADAWWLWEATAAWAEDEMTPGAPFVGSYLRHMPSWYLLWGMGLSLKSFNQQDATIRLMPYGSSAYFKYLSEHDPAGPAIVRRIWEGVGAAGPGDSMGVIRQTLGEDRYRDLFGDFAVAVPLKTRAPWDFRRGAEIGSQIIPRTSWNGWYYDLWDAAQRRIAPRELRLEPFSASYVELIAPDKQQVSAPLRLIVKPKDAGAALLVKVIRFSGASRDAVEGVDEIPLPASGQPGQLRLESYGPFSDRTNRVLVVVANPSGSATQMDLAAAVSDPPFLSEIRIEQPGKGNVYEARWNEGGGATRSLNVVKNELKLNLGEDHVENLSVDLTFSREIEGVPLLQVGSQNIRLTEIGGNRGRLWTGQVGRLSFQGPPRVSKLPLLIQASSPDGLALDPHPATVPLLDPQPLHWHDYEPGGIDRTHLMEVKKFDLNGLWRSGSTQMRIIHERQSVRGLTPTGKVLFQGTLTGYAINGRMRVRYPPEWQARCPGQAEGWAGLRMTASEDAERISGRFELMEIDENCNQVPAGWKEILLERVPDESRGSWG